jgi:hypothetical protein
MLLLDDCHHCIFPVDCSWNNILAVWTVSCLNLDICGCNNEIVLCHNSCLVTRNTKEVYAAIVSFLDRNPTEILLITMELNSELDQAIDLDNVYAEMQTVDGFVDYMYVHTQWLAPWPTLRELKEAGKVRASCENLSE